MAQSWLASSVLQAGTKILFHWKSVEGWRYCGCNAVRINEEIFDTPKAEWNGVELVLAEKRKTRRPPAGDR